MLYVLQGSVCSGLRVVLQKAGYGVVVVEERI